MQEINITKWKFNTIPRVFFEKITLEELERVTAIGYVSSRSKRKQQNRTRGGILFFCQRRMAFIDETLSTAVIGRQRWFQLGLSLIWSLQQPNSSNKTQLSWTSPSRMWQQTWISQTHQKIIWNSQIARSP